MPITYTFLSSSSAIIVRATGVVTLEQFLDHLGALVADPAIPSQHITLIDTRDVTELRLSEEDIEKIASFTMLHSSRIVAKQLAIVTRGDRETALAAQYERIAATFKENTIVFYNIDVACKWLGIPRDALKPTPTFSVSEA